MTGYGPMLAKEFREFVRTWRIWALLGVFAFFGIVDPVISRFTPEILASVLGDQLPVQLPEPTHLDAAAQWTGDLTQLLMLVVLGIAAASIAGEVARGTHVLPLTKPLTRPAFVLAKVSCVVVMTAVAAAVGTGLGSVVTLLLFDGVDLLPLWTAVGVWFVLALVLIAVTVAAACAVSSTVAALGIGFGVHVLLGIAGMWGPARSYSPAGLADAVGRAAAGASVPVWPLVGGVVVAGAVLLLGLVVFRRREL
ncbi:MAG: ABC transporter permease subunit [bacterium]|nr:ABC transporter permease subunit [bacterium]